MPEEKQLVHGLWITAFVDLLGQKEAFLKTDFMPDAADPESLNALVSAMTDSLGVVRSLRKLLETFRQGSVSTGLSEDSPLKRLSQEQITQFQKMKRRQVRELRWSDGIVLYAPLWTTEDHSPIMGVYEILGTLAVLMLMQLAAGKPVRGGVDTGTGIEEDGQLFGAALVKAYLLESKVAQHPRIVAGDGIAKYLEAVSSRSPTSLEAQFGNLFAPRLRGLLCPDEDGATILDYAGAPARAIFSSSAPLGLFQMARTFAQTSRERWRTEGNQKLFERYSKVVRYLDARVDAHKPDGS